MRRKKSFAALSLILGCTLALAAPAGAAASDVDSSAVSAEAAASNDSENPLNGKTLDEITEAAKKEGEKAALEEAKRRGATGNIRVRSWEYQKEISARTGERVRFGLSVFAEAAVLFD